MEAGKRTSRKKVVEPAQIAVEVPVVEAEGPAAPAPGQAVQEPEPVPAALPTQAESLVVNLAAQEEKAPVFPQTSSPAQNPFIASYQADLARKKRLMWTLVILVVLIIIGGAGYLYWRSSQLHGQIGDTLTDDSVKTVVARVERLAAVPDGEQPTVALIRNADLASAQQDFYQGASSGDILLVYSDRAIIYDPRADKIVNMNSILRASPEPSPSPEAASPTPVPQPLTVEVRNGTSVAGRAKATGDAIKKDNPLFSISSVGDASKASSLNIIVDQSKGKNTELVASLERLLGVKAQTTLPKGERASTADILVIVGK